MLRQPKAEVLALKRTLQGFAPTAIRLTYCLRFARVQNDCVPLCSPARYRPLPTNHLSGTTGDWRLSDKGGNLAPNAAQSKKRCTMADLQIDVPPHVAETIRAIALLRAEHHRKSTFAE